MKFKYKVWAEIEEEDTSGEVEPERVGEPECVGCFDTNDKAIDFVSGMESGPAEIKRLDNVAQTKVGECMKLTAERDDMRDLLEEAAGTFGKIGTDEPVSGADTVDWLNDWIPRVREFLGAD